jgi:hypothetical protein
MKEFRNGTKVGITSATVLGNAPVPTPTLFTDTGLSPATSPPVGRCGGRQGHRWAM